MSEFFIPQAGAKELLLWLLGRRRRVRVSGESMQPLLSPAAELLYAPYVRRAPAPGDIVVARHPFRTDLLLVKILTALTASGEYLLHGLNPTESTDSRTFGAVPRHLLLGRITSRLP
ncbi:MAG: nickel-type superoxide dismutase maturation protease [Blastocatellia bacterium]